MHHIFGIDASCYSDEYTREWTWPAHLLLLPGATVRMSEYTREMAKGVVVAYNHTNASYRVCFGTGRLLHPAEKIGDVMKDLGFTVSDDVCVYKSIVHGKIYCCIGDQRYVFDVKPNDLTEAVVVEQFP